MNNLAGNRNDIWILTKNAREFPDNTKEQSRQPSDNQRGNQVAGYFRFFYTLIFACSCILTGKSHHCLPKSHDRKIQKIFCLEINRESCDRILPKTIDILLYKNIGNGKDH